MDPLTKTFKNYTELVNHSSDVIDDIAESLSTILKVFREEKEDPVSFAIKRITKYDIKVQREIVARMTELLKGQEAPASPTD
jgi:hypothetical protein